MIHTGELERPEYRANPANRCYYCKDELYGQLRALAAERGFAVVVDGNNADDRGDYRPGRQAAREHGVKSPLDEADLTKDDIRALARAAGLESWNEPASACLSSRIPYGTEVSNAILRQIEQAETAVRELGFRVFRVRHHDTVARLEIARDEMARALDPEINAKLVAALKATRLSIREPRPAGLSPGQPERGAAAAAGFVTARRALTALALVFALAHLPFLPTTLEDIDSVNFALGVRDFDVGQHRPHPPGYPVYIALGKIATAIAGLRLDRRRHRDRGAMRSPSCRCSAGCWRSCVCIACSPACAAESPRPRSRPRRRRALVDYEALAATAITASCPLFWYLGVRPMSDLPGLAAALAALVCLMLAWWRQAPGPDGDRRLSPAGMAASGRMIVIGAFLAGSASACARRRCGSRRRCCCSCCSIASAGAWPARCSAAA